MSHFRGRLRGSPGSVCVLGRCRKQLGRWWLLIPNGVATATPTGAGLSFVCSGHETGELVCFLHAMWEVGGAGCSPLHSSTWGFLPLRSAFISESGALRLAFLPSPLPGSGHERNLAENSPELSFWQARAGDSVGCWGKLKACWNGGGEFQPHSDSEQPKCHQGSVSLAKCTHGLSLRRPPGEDMGRGLADIPPLGPEPHVCPEL